MASDETGKSCLRREEVDLLKVDLRLLEGEVDQLCHNRAMIVGDGLGQ